MNLRPAVCRNQKKLNRGCRGYAQMGQSTSSVFIRGDRRHPRFFFVVFETNSLRGTQSNQLLAVRMETGA